MWKMPLTGKPLLVILGATAVGKTELALSVAQALNGEIVGADSRQIYTLMDIGTAKPSLEERARVPHHLIDLIPPDGDLSLANYQRLAYAAINDIHARGKLPLLVGGTGQYITAVIEGWSPPEVPPNPELRAELEAFAATQGWEALFARLLAVDPDAQAFIEPRNIRRVVRAIEVTQLTGRPFSAQRQKQPPPYQVYQYGLTMEREHLYERADRRVDAMLADGFSRRSAPPARRRLRARPALHERAGLSGVSRASVGRRPARRRGDAHEKCYPQLHSPPVNLVSRARSGHPVAQ